MVPEELSTIVLAGGQSSRMGQDKALIRVQGLPLLRRICQVGLECSSAVYVVTPWVDRYSAIVPPACHLVSEQLVEPGQPHGPLLGFLQGLQQVQTEWVLLLACDLPYLHPKAVRQWMQGCDRGTSAIAQLPKGEKGWEPLCGFYRTDCLPRLQNTIDQGTRSFQQWLAVETVLELPIRDRRVLFNCNTPLDLQALNSQAFL